MQPPSQQPARVCRALAHTVGARGSGRVSVPAHQRESWERCATEAGGRCGDAHAAGPGWAAEVRGSPRWGPAMAMTPALRPWAHLNAYCTQWGGACQGHFHFTHKEIKFREVQSLATPGLKPRRFDSASGSPDRGGLFTVHTVYIRPRRSRCVYPSVPHCRRGTEAQ